MVQCKIKGCKNKSIKHCGISFHTFPKDPCTAKAWLRFCRPINSSKDARVCSKHFLPSDYFMTLRNILNNKLPQKTKILKPDAVPSLELGTITKTDQWHKNETENVMSNVYLQTETETKYYMDVNTHTDNLESTTNTEIIVKNVKNCTSNRGIVTVKRETYAEVSENTNSISKNRDTYIKIPLHEYDDVHTRIKELEKLLKQKNKIEEQFNNLQNKLRNIFSPGQIRCLMSDEQVKWCAEDIAAAKTLQNISSDAYEYLRTTVGMPLPNPCTLRRYSMFYVQEESQNV